jgi:hypothetical protein
LDEIAGELEAVDPRLALAVDMVSDRLDKEAITDPGWKDLQPDWHTRLKKLHKTPAIPAKKQSDLKTFIGIFKDESQKALSWLKEDMNTDHTALLKARMALNRTKETCEELINILKD